MYCRHLPNNQRPAFVQVALEAVTEQLVHLRQADGEEAAFERALYILESLASVRSCVILAEMACPQEGEAAGDDDEGNDEREEPLIRMFEVLLDAIQ